MQHELAIAAEKPGRVNAQRKVALDALPRAESNHARRVSVDPSAFHGPLFPARSRSDGWTMIS
jgi:hypothetical protein